MWGKTTTSTFLKTLPFLFKFYKVCTRKGLCVLFVTKHRNLRDI